MAESPKEKTKTFENARKILEELELSAGPVMGTVYELPSLRQALYVNFRKTYVGALSMENIGVLLEGLDPYVLSLRGLFAVLDQFKEFTTIGKTNNLRIVGLLVDGPWLVIDIYPEKIVKMPQEGIELRDCFKISKISSANLSVRDCLDMLFVPEDINTITLTFHYELDEIMRDLERKIFVLREYKQRLEKILLKQIISPP